MNMGDIPSFCTACYRAGRTGDRFMSLCKSKQISNCCHPNALMTLMEYLQDYASPETKKVGMELIQKELENIPSEKVKRLTEEHLADIINVVHYADEQDITVNVYLEDWSNGMKDSPEYVFQLMDGLKATSIKRYMLPDTLGILNPLQVIEYMRKMKKTLSRYAFRFPCTQ